MYKNNSHFKVLVQLHSLFGQGGCFISFDNKSGEISISKSFSFCSSSLRCIHCHYCHHPELHPPAQVAGLSISMAMAIITIHGRHRRPHHGHPAPPAPPAPPPRDHDEIGVSGGP